MAPDQALGSQRSRSGADWVVASQLAFATVSAPMKIRVTRSNRKRKKKVGFRTRSKTAGGRKIIKRKLKRAGKFRVG